VQFTTSLWRFAKAGENNGTESVSAVQNKYVSIADSTLLVYVEKIELYTPTIGRNMPMKFIWQKINAGTASRPANQMKVRPTSD
jgi:hypothetical protein